MLVSFTDVWYAGAAIRRHMNNDLRETVFREHVAEYVQDVPSLVPHRGWRDFSELCSIIYGYHIEQLHGEIKPLCDMVTNFREHIRSERGFSKYETKENEMTRRLTYLKAAMVPGNYYATPSIDGTGGCQIFQLVSLNPSRKHYMQKTAMCGVDLWKDTAAVASVTLPSHSDPPDTVGILKKHLTVNTIGFDTLCSDAVIRNLCVYQQVVPRQVFDFPTPILADKAMEELDDPTYRQICHIGSQFASKGTVAARNIPDHMLTWMEQNSIICRRFNFC